MTIPLSLVLAHFVGDFLLQNDKMAINKSKKLEWLTIHVFIYSLCFLPFGWKMFLVTFYLHMVTDYFTSRWTSKLWFIDLQERPHEPAWFRSGGCLDHSYFARILPTRHWFFVVIGLDQLIHYVTLGLTYNLLAGVLK